MRVLLERGNRLVSVPFQTSRLVEFADTDMAGIMHFSAFFRYMEAAEHELLRSLGFSVYSEIDGDVVSFPRVAASCEFHSPARCEDVLEIDVSVKRVGTKSVTYGFQFTQMGRDVATGEMTSVCCRVPHGQPPVSIAIPDVVAAKLRELAGNSIKP
jgi:4-hydroxybenzoyl-CoA thioesterase/acyl-CoA thioester hydrolase